jgi:hypothetical protein
MTHFCTRNEPTEKHRYECGALPLTLTRSARGELPDRCYYSPDKQITLDGLSATIIREEKA